MKICAVICELNPFHNGHAYIFKEARRQSGCDAVLALMSGNFVQRAEPAVVDAYARAECALRGGADLVAELPVVYAVAAADVFARGAVDILNKIPAVDCLAMGVESDNFALIATLASVQASETENFRQSLRAALDAGFSYPQALTEATAQAAAACGCDIEEARAALAKPNNILAVAYKKALIKTGSRLRFLPVRRAGGDISEEFSGKYSSASALRQRLDDPRIAEAMPASAYEVLMREPARGGVDAARYDALMLAALRLGDLAAIRCAPDCAEGMEYKLRELAENCTSFGDMLSAVSTSRFTRGRIARICVQTLLGIGKDLPNVGYRCARLLGVREDKRDLLSILPDSIIINKQGEKAIPAAQRVCFEADKKAAAVYSIITRSRGNGFYRKLLII